MGLFSNVFRLPALDLVERRVFLRADLDVPASAFGGVLDDRQLRALLPTLRALLAVRARVVVGAHYGHAGEPAQARAVATRLAELLGQPVPTLDTNFLAAVAERPLASVALTPNLLEFPAELANHAAYADELSRSFDAYVGDDVATAVREWTSVEALPRLVPTRGAGHCLGRDLDMLELLVDPGARRPLVGVVGGDGFARKMPFMRLLVPRVDALVFGGAVANTLLAAQGWNPGASRYEPASLEAARALLAAARARGVRVHLPVDMRVNGRDAEPAATLDRPLADLRPDEALLDIGLETNLAYRDVLAQAGTVVWNGAMGDAERDAFARGSFLVAQAITTSATKTLVFGRRTVALLERLGVAPYFSHVSRSGSAAHALFAGSILPGVESLRSAL